MLGQTLGHFEILEKIGAGGMGEVYRAHDTNLDRDVALKILPTQAVHEKARKQFRREALALARLKHANIGTIHDFGSENGVDFLVMELVEGTDLAAKLGHGPLPEAQVVDLGIQVARALEEAHSKEIVHRDLKPANIMVTANNEAKVLDFGLARLVRPVGEASTLSMTDARAIVGTLPYMAPEQVQGTEVDSRTDIYALGATLYEMASGQRAFKETDRVKLMLDIVQSEPSMLRTVAPNLSPDFERVIHKALERQPVARYQSACELREDLERVRAGLPVEAPRRRRPLAHAALAVVSVVVIGIALWTAHRTGLLNRWRTTDPGHVSSLAILPLQNLSGDPAEEYFADGVTDILTANLAQLQGLDRVIGRQSMLRFKGSQNTASEIAAEMGVDAILQASVLREGSRIQMTAQLIERGTDRVMWADTFDRAALQMLPLMREITLLVSSEIGATLAPELARETSTTRAVAPEVLEAYFKGSFQLHKWTRDSVEQGIEFFKAALQMDSTYAPAYVGVANGYMFLGHMGLEVIPTNEAFPKAKKWIEQALEIDPLLPEARVAMGEIHLYWKLEWEKAEKEYQRALELAPNSSRAHGSYGVLLEALGRYDEAIAHGQRCQQLEPRDPWEHTSPMWRYIGAGRAEEALAEAEESLEIHPDFWVANWGKGFTFVLMGRHEDAVQVLRKALHESSGNSNVLATLGLAYAAAGMRDSALVIAANLQDPTKFAYTPSYSLANIYDALGDTDRAMRWLERSYDERSVYLYMLKRDRFFQHVRSDPRFNQLVERIGIP